MEIIYSFKFAGGYVFEVNNINVPKSEPSKKYQWYFYENKNLTKLIFNKIDGHKRYFENGYCLDMDNLFFRANDVLYVMEKCSENDCRQIYNILKLNDVGN